MKNDSLSPYADKSLVKMFPGQTNFQGGSERSTNKCLRNKRNSQGANLNTTSGEKLLVQPQIQMMIQNNKSSRVTSHLRNQNLKKTAQIYYNQNPKHSNSIQIKDQFEALKQFEKEIIVDE